MKRLSLALLCSFLSCLAVISQSSTVPIFESTTGINDVIFKDTTYSKNNIGCAFLLIHQSDTFAIAAKHTLAVAHHPKMKTTNFEGTLEGWRIYPRHHPGNYVLCEELLNTDKLDSVNFRYIGRNWYSYNDYLIFKIKENQSDLNPLRIRTTPIRKGEKLYALGWTYWDVEGSQRIYEFSYEKTRGTMLLLNCINAPANGGGLSGSPVVDENGNLVAIVSGAGADENRDDYLSVCSVEYLNGFF